MVIKLIDWICIVNFNDLWILFKCFIYLIVWLLSIIYKRLDFNCDNSVKLFSKVLFCYGVVVVVCKDCV